jgi:hypothetical protein
MVPKTMAIVQMSEALDEAELPTTGSMPALGMSSLPEGCCMDETNIPLC